MTRREKDVQWLGEDDAWRGPAVRAALGFLLDRDEWGWWDAPSQIARCLRQTVRSNGLVNWGGDASVLNAEQWIEPSRAVALAQAFEALRSKVPLTIKISRSVWHWDGGADTVATVMLELSLLVGEDNIFPEWQRNAKPRFPHLSKERPSSYQVAGPDLSLDSLMEGDSEQLSWEWVTLRSDIVDILLVSQFASLDSVTAAKLVIIQGHTLQAALAQVSRLRDDLFAHCVLLTDADDTDVVQWLQRLMAFWPNAGVDFAHAMRQTAAELEISVRILSSTQAFLSARHEFPGHSTIVRDREIAEPEPIYQVVLEHRPPPVMVETPDTKPRENFPPRVPADDGAFLEQEPQTPAKGFGQSGRVGRRPPADLPRKAGRPHPPRKVKPSPPMERVLTASVHQGVEEITRWPTSGVVDIDLAIVVKTPLHISTPTFPEDRIEWDDDYKQLKVHLFEYGQAPDTQSFWLPKTKGSPTVRFSREVRMGAVDLRFLVSDDAQILQTARLQAQPDGLISFFIENIVTPLHREKKTFDLALLVNDSLGNQPSLSIIPQTGQPMFVPLSEGEIEAARRELLSTLQFAVDDPDASLDQSLLDLAISGSLLQQRLKELEPRWPGNEGRLQLVSQDDASFPIEYLYDGPTPESGEAELCSQRATCLKRGSAEPDCAIRKAREQLCPMGFLGISGVIERHAWKPGVPPNLWARSALEQPGRLRIEDLSKIAFTASNQADDFHDDDVGQEVVRIAHVEAALDVRRIETWREWKAELEDTRPSMLLMIVHKESNKLIVGAGSSLPLSSIDEGYVGGASIVIAIGCSTGRSSMPGSSLPAILRRSGADVVVAAMTSVLGRHANRVARDLAKFMRNAASRYETVLVGEIISALRRQLLLDGVALGLAVVAFGDVDIALGREAR